MTTWPVVPSIGYAFGDLARKQPRATITWCRDTSAIVGRCAPEATPSCGDGSAPTSCRVCLASPVCQAHRAGHVERTRIPVDTWKTLRRFRPDDPDPRTTMVARLLVCYPPDTSKAELPCGFKA